MRINPAFITKLLPATVVKLAKMAPEDVITEHETRIQELERSQLGLPPEPERLARDIVNQKLIEEIGFLKGEVERLSSEIELLKAQPRIEQRKGKKFL